MLAPQGYLSVDKRRVEYRWLEANPASETTLIFLHEGLGCAGLWKDFPQQIVQKSGISALNFSRFGYGRSDPVDLPRPLSYMHDEARSVLPQILNAAQIRNPVLIGHSDGASIALIYAAMPGAQCRALVLMAPHVFAEQIGLDAIEQAGRAFRCGGLRGRLERHHGANVDGAFWGWHDAWLAPDFRHWNIEALLPKIEVPVLLLQGENDEYGTLAQIHALQKQLGGDVQTVLLPGCGHSPFREQKKACESAILGFLSRHRYCS